MRLLTGFLLLLAALPLAAKPCGRVFADGNGNGRFDPGEAGLAGIAVSDGEHIVRSGRDGRYRLAARAGKTLFVIKPPGYALPRRDDGLPDFFANQASTVGGLKYGGVSQSDTACKNFALKPLAKPVSGELNVWVLGDPQPKTALDTGYYRDDIIAPLAKAPAADLAITLGDIVSDDLRLLPVVKRIDSQLGLPWLYAAGNHDMDFDAEDDAFSLESFRAQFGPDTFAWEETQANFLVLDNVISLPEQSPRYIGGLRDSQFHFLARYLAGADKNKLLVISAHIPFFEQPGGKQTFRAEDRVRLFRLLSPFRDVLLLTAHAHAQHHVQHGPATDWHGQGRLYEYTAGAACGGYWSGIKDAAGIPDSVMSDGTPNGYASLHITQQGYRLQWFNARQSPNAAMALYAPKVLRQGAYPAVSVYANVFMARPDAQVEFSIDDGPWLPMQRSLESDPRVLAVNLRDNAAEVLSAYDRTPEATPSSHLWKAALPTNLATGIHRIRVRAIDAWLGEVEQETQYRLLEARP